MQFLFTSSRDFIVLVLFSLSRSENCNSRCTSAILNSWCLQHMSKLRRAGPLGSCAYLWTSHWNHKMEGTLLGGGLLPVSENKQNKNSDYVKGIGRSIPVSVYTQPHGLSWGWSLKENYSVATQRLSTSTRWIDTHYNAPTCTAIGTDCPPVSFTNTLKIGRARIFMVLEAQVSELGSCALGNHWKHPQRCVRNCGQTLSEAFYLVIFSPNRWPLCQHTSQPALIVGPCTFMSSILLPSSL